MRWWLVIGWVLALTACGQAGDLYLPDRSTAPARPVSAAAPAMPATAGGR